MFVPDNRLLDKKIDTGIPTEPTAATDILVLRGQELNERFRNIVRGIGESAARHVKLEIGMEDTPATASALHYAYMLFDNHADEGSYDATDHYAINRISEMSEEDRTNAAQELTDAIIKYTELSNEKEDIKLYTDAQYLSALMTLRNTSGLAVGISRKDYPRPERDRLEASINDSFSRVTNAIDGLQQAIDKANTLDLDTLRLQQLKDRLEQTITRDTTAATETGAENSSTEEVTDASETHQNRVDALIGG